LTFSFVKTNASIKNVQLYYLSGSNWQPITSNCAPLSSKKWKCASIFTDVKKSTGSVVFSLRADLGLTSNASILTVISGLGLPTNVGDVVWMDLASSEKYSWVSGSSVNLFTDLTGGGNGSLYDTAGPQIVSIDSFEGGSCKLIEKEDTIIIKFNEVIDPTSIHYSANIFPIYNFAGPDDPGRAVICDDGSGNVSYIAVQNIFEYQLFLQNQTCKKYATKYRINADGSVYVKINDNGTTIPTSPTPQQTVSITDANNNKMTTAPPVPSGTWLCP